MKQTALQHKNMKQLMKTKHSGDIGLFQHINHAAHRITQTAGSQQTYRCTAHGLENGDIK